MQRIGLRAAKEIAEVLCGIGDVKLMRRFLEGILTPRELEEIGGRWELLKLLETGVSQRRIAKELGLSLCKITRGSRELKKNNSAVKEVLGEYLGLIRRRKA
jgi:TrpR family trp operon transcriptional repressor